MCLRPLFLQGAFFLQLSQKYFEKCLFISIVCFIFALQLKTTTMTNLEILTETYGNHIGSNLHLMGYTYKQTHVKRINKMIDAGLSPFQIIDRIK